MRSGVLHCCLALTIGLLSEAYAQTIPLNYHYPDKRTQLENYYRDRLVQLRFRLRNKITREINNVVGSGFIVSPAGHAITARHVLEPLVSGQFELAPGGGWKAISVRRSQGGEFQELNLDADSIVLSTQADVALFKLHLETQQPLDKFMCIEFADARNDFSTAVTTAAWLFADLTRYKSLFQFDSAARIRSREGPGPLSDYWQLETPFDKSMSGGPVVRSDRVIGVLSGTLARDNGQEIPGANYFTLLQNAGDLNLQIHASRCLSGVPAEIPLRQYPSQSAFMSTPEGTVAWIPQGSTGEHWAFLEGGNYGLRKDYFACDTNTSCGCTKARAQPYRSIQFVINHRIASDVPDPACKRFAGDRRTFYGVQIVPVFQSERKGVVREETWLYKNANLYERTINGKFVENKSPRGVSSPRRPPSEFNQVILDVQKIAAARPNSCAEALSEDDCVDILRIQYFKREMANWPGFPRAADRPVSTLSNPREDWRVPRDWLVEQDLQVKNYILRYFATKDKHTTSPVTFDLCPDADWIGFYFRVFSPERCIEGPYVHVFLQE